MVKLVADAETILFYLNFNRLKMGEKINKFFNISEIHFIPIHFRFWVYSVYYNVQSIFFFKATTRAHYSFDAAAI